MVRSTYCSCREHVFSSQYPYTQIASPAISGDPLLSSPPSASGTHVVQKHTCKTKTYKINKSLKRREMEKGQRLRGGGLKREGLGKGGLIRGGLKGGGLVRGGIKGGGLKREELRERELRRWCCLDLVHSSMSHT